MRKIFYVLLVSIVVICGCSKPKQTTIFKGIDYSYFFGYYYSIKIFNNGKTYINIQNEYGFHNYSLILNSNQLDSLSELVSNLGNSLIDSIILAPESHGQTFCLIVDYGNTKKSVSYAGDFADHNLSYLYKLVLYLNDMKNGISEMADSSFIFESRNKLILPPSP